MRLRNFKRTTAPATTPVSLSDIENHLRISGLTDVYEQALIDSLILSAVDLAEKYCRSAFITQTLTGKGDDLEPEIMLPQPPLVSITSVNYQDNENTDQTLSTDFYEADVFSVPGKMVKKYNQSYPTILAHPSSVTIVWVAGYGGAADVPHAIKQALKLLVGQWYENRENLTEASLKEMPWACRSLLDLHRLPEVW